MAVMHSTTFKILNTPDYMLEAIKEARFSFMLDEVPVGAVMVDPKKGKIISIAGNRMITLKDPTAHAEILAIRAACKYMNSSRLDNFDLYTTLEPCCMCAAAISLARIRRLYYGAHDRINGSVHHGARAYSNSSLHHIPDVYSNIHEETCSAILHKFFNEKRQNKHLNCNTKISSYDT